jgi:hypothetical protein
VGILDGHEQREVVQPVRLRPAETIEPFLHRAAAGGVEALKRSRPERPTMGDDAGEVDVARWEGLAARLGLREQAVLDQPFEADEHRIAREG